jgi:hypothetical protein
MTSAPVNAADLPPYTLRQSCRACRRRTPALVVFDRECREVAGEHTTANALACGARWLEQCGRKVCMCEVSSNGSSL